jgi:UDP-N-acetylglucosamine 2-epimerase (non-hydrolysing)
MKIILVVGARPNFMKIAPIIEEIESCNMRSQKKIDYLLVHTGQHYDEKMSKLFFEELEIPKPHINLEVGSASHAVQTAEIMKKFEGICLAERPSHVLVVGDVNSSLACALVASKLNIQVIHVEAGLRSFDRTMPEEINRVLTDAISDYLFITEKSAEENLLREGVPQDKIFFVGNVMIDTLLKHKEKAQKEKILQTHGLKKADVARVDDYCLLTLHRPSNVDDRATFQKIVEALTEISKRIKIIFPIHPRTLQRIGEFGFETYFALKDDAKKNDHLIQCIEPLGYLDFLCLMSNAKLVMTDSGGIQEETTALGIPCVTLRENTERPVTVTHGTNVIAGLEVGNIIKAVEMSLNGNGNYKKSERPPFWDGHSARRIVEVLTGRKRLTVSQFTQASVYKHNE